MFPFYMYDYKDIYLCGNKYNNSILIIIELFSHMALMQFDLDNPEVILCSCVHHARQYRCWR